MPSAALDPYSYHPRHIEAPPTSIVGTLRRVGPGILLTASIVGTGELIATTRLGAEVGYTMLWAIIISCLLKTVVQAVWGRYTIVTGETGLAAVNHVPGPRFLNVNWVVWIYALMIVFAFTLTAAMFAGVAQVMVRFIPGIALGVWVIVLALITLAVLLSGSYRRIEVLATWMVVLFSFMTVLAAVVLMSKPEYFTWSQVADGLKFTLPEQGIITAIAVFGITGVNSGELFAYPYWCVEKGYARFTGPREDSDAWRQRARGWIRVMHFDVAVSMLIYTLTTIAFYLLGAGVLHTLGTVPQGNAMIETLSTMYQQTMGTFGLYLFYVGAVFVLYSTVFASVAANSRIFADMLRLIGLFQPGDYRARVRYQNLFIVALTVLPCGVYFAIGEPVRLVRAGGVTLALVLPIIGASILYLRYRRLPANMLPTNPTTALLWLVAGLFVITTAISLASQFGLIKQ